MVHLLELAISDTPGTVPFFISADSGLTGQSSLLPVSALGLRNQVDVSVTTLDHYLDETATTPDVIKIDVEGAEIHALKGMEQTLAAHRPAVLCELYGPEGAETPRRVIQWMASRGYVASELEPTGCLRAVAAESPELDDWYWRNVIFTPAERLSGGRET
jgi:hypothetical protein